MIEERKFGRTIAGEDIVLYSLKNKNGMQADVMNFGAILVNLFVPDKNGEVKDVVLGYDRAKDYFVNGSCFGSTIGPVANRTAKGQFELDGTIYNLIINDNVALAAKVGADGVHIGQSDMGVEKARAILGKERGRKCSDILCFLQGRSAGISGKP